MGAKTEMLSSHQSEPRDSTADRKNAAAIRLYGIHGPECQGNPNQACLYCTINALTPSSESTTSP